MTRPTFAVIGDPVAHSLSPRLFAWLFARQGLEAHYTALRVQSQAELTELLDRTRRGALAGLSITRPHKEAVLPLLDAVHPLAARVGAVNCVMRTAEGELHGFNTDVHGVRAALDEAGRPLAGARVLLLGAGGAGRAAAFAALSSGAKSLVLANRTHERARELGLELVESGLALAEGELRRAWEGGVRPQRREGGGRLAPLDAAGRATLGAARLEAGSLALPLARADVVIQATAAGQGAPLEDPLPEGLSLPAGATVLDMVYHPRETALLRRAVSAGARPVGGLAMLVHQALEQLRLWTGVLAPPTLAAELQRYLAHEAET